MANHPFLPFGQFALRAEQLQFVLIGVQSGQFGSPDVFGVHRLQGDVGVGGIVHDVLQQVELLGQHGLGVVILHLHVLQVDVDALQVHFHRHAVVVEGLGDVAQFAQAADVLPDDAYLFGSDIIVAPVTEAGRRECEVYLPSGTEWISIPDGNVLEGGRRHHVSAPLERIPFFIRKDSRYSSLIDDIGGLYE